MTSVLVTELISRASQNNTNIRHVTREIGIPDETVKDWMRGTVEPTEDEVRRFCEKLNVDIPKVKNKTAEKKESVVSKPVKKRMAEEKSSTVVPAGDDFMPAPELFSEDKSAKDGVPTLDELSKTALECSPDKFVVGEITETKKEEKKMEEIKNAAAESPKAVDKPKRTRSASLKKGEKKQLLSEESEAFVRKSIGLKKSEEITEKAVVEAFKSGVDAIKQKMTELSRLESDVTKALFATSENSPVDERLKKLLDAAEKATDEGITVAITILEKFKR